MHHFLKYDLVPALSAAAVCAFPCVFQYARNAAEVPPGSMVPFLLVFGINAVLLCIIFAPVFRNFSRTACFVDFAMIWIINFCLFSFYLKQLIPGFRDRYLLLICLIALGALCGYFVKKKPDMRTVCLLILIAFGSMILMNCVFAVPELLRTHEVRREFVTETGNPEETEVISQKFTGPLPNVYYFVFDEYGGYDNLLHYYDYDNMPFLRELEERGFSVSLYSRNTEAIHTDTLIPNLLNLDYVVEPDDPYHKKELFRDNCRMFRMFAGNGYEIQLVDHLDYIGKSGCRVLTANQTRRTISEFLMRNSIYSKSKFLKEQLEQFFVMDYGAAYRDSLDNVLDVSLHLCDSMPDVPVFTMGYLQCPHSPMMVGPNGEELPFAEGWNWRNHELFLGQTEFINRFILELTDYIQRSDPNALIILQSDHGNRYALHMCDLGEWESYDPHIENPYMQNILNCVYYHGEKFEIEGESGINTLRMVFNAVLGTDLEYIEPVIDFSDCSGDEKS